MNLTFARADMASALGRLVALIPTRSTLPVATYARITPLADGESVRVEATDLSRHGEITMRLSEPCMAFSPLCLPLGTLLGAAKDFPGVSATMKVAGDMVVFASAGSRVKLPTIPGEEFPHMRFEDLSFEDAGGGPAGPFLLALHRVSHAICTEYAKPALLGVNFRGDGDGVVVAALDGPRIAKEIVRGWDATPTPHTIPTDGVRALLNFFPPSASLALRTSDSRLRFSDDDGATLTLPTLDEPFPNIDVAIPKDSRIIVRADRSALLAAVRRAKMVLPTNGAGRLIFTVSSDGLSLHAESEVGVADEDVAADAEGGGLRIGLNVGFVIDALTSFAGEQVIAEMSAPERAVLWREPDGDGVRVLAPLRLLS